MNLGRRSTQQTCGELSDGLKVIRRRSWKASECSVRIYRRGLNLNGELKTGLAEVRTELKTGLLEVNRRVDRLFYAILAMGGALFVAIVVSNFTNS